MARHDDSWISEVAGRLAEYGYGLADDGVILKSTGSPTGVQLQKKGNRLRAVQLGSGALFSGATLWSGADIGDFVERYWYAKRVPQQLEHAAPFPARTRVKHITIRGTPGNYRLGGVDEAIYQELLREDDQEALRSLIRTYDYFDDAHDRAQRIFRNATVSSL